MIKNYKVCVKGNSSIAFNGEIEYTMRDYWTTIKLEEGMTDWWVKYYAKPNLMKQISKDLVGHCRAWKRVYIDVSDMEIVRC